MSNEFSNSSNSIPAHAASIWLSGDLLFLSFPGTRNHTVELKINESTLPTLLSVLRNRARSTNLNSIGLPETPTQFNLDAIMKAFGGKVKVVGKKREFDDLTLEDLEIEP